MSYVYLKSEPDLFTVGFFQPNGNWEAESDHSTAESAAARVHWLNGGNPEGPAPNAEDQTIDDAEENPRWERI